MTSIKAKEDALFNEKFDIEFEILEKLQTLIDASWDSNTLKSEIESRLKQVDIIWKAIHDLGTCCKQCEAEGNK